MKVQGILDRLKGVKPNGGGWIALCPAHADHNPSLSVRVGENGGVLLHCHTGCPTASVVQALRLTMKDLAPAPAMKQLAGRRIVATYPFHDADGEFLFEVVRYEPKDFRQRRPDPSKPGGYMWNLRGVRRVPFRLPELLAAVKAGKQVFICEGEKDCLAMVQAGAVATCNPGGAGKWKREFNEYFQGVDVVVIADRDEPGRQHAQKVASTLHGAAKSVRVIELPDIGGKHGKDAADFLAAGGTLADIRELADSAPLWSPALAPIEPAQGTVIKLPGDNRPVSAFATELVNALRGAELFNRGGLVATLNWRRDGLEPMSADTFRTWCERLVLFVRTRPGSEVIRTMSKEDANAVLTAPQFLEALPRVERVNPVRLPVRRADGNLTLLPAGYDAPSMTYTLDGCPYAEGMPVETAEAVIADLFSEFPFFGEDGRSRAVAIAALFSLYCGGLLPPGAPRPVFLSLANDVGAGKTTLWRLVLMIVCGSATLTSRPKDEDELRKALLSAVLQAAPYLFLDNLKGHLSSPALEAFTTSDTWRDRILGHSRLFCGDNRVTLFLTGNGVTISPDIARRALIVELFQAYERPQDHSYRRRLDTSGILALRREALAACWALVKGWDQAGRPKPTRSNSSFPAWADVVAGIVEHAGFGSCLEPHASALGGDMDAEDVRELVERMSDRGGWLRFPDVASLAVEAGLFGLEPDDWTDVGAKQGTRRRVGSILRRNAGKLFSLRAGPARLETRGRSRTAEYRVMSPERGNIGDNGAIGAAESPDIEPSAPTSCTDVTDSTDFIPPEDHELFHLEQPTVRHGIPD